MKNSITISLIALSALASGCSTLTADGTSQNLSVMTYSVDNKDLVGASCELKNDEGTWSAVTPATVMVHRSNKDLIVKCTKSGYSDARANVVSKTKANMFGNIIFGGGIGAIIDHNNGSAYQYPPVLKMTMGEDKIIKEGSN
jgi:heterodisulfide reductase subunit B